MGRRIAFGLYSQRKETSQQSWSTDVALSSLCLNRVPLERDYEDAAVVMQDRDKGGAQQ